MKSFAPEVAQFADGVSAEQQIESVNPASLVHGVVEVEEGLGLTVLGTLLIPKTPMDIHREHFPRSLLQHIEYL